MKCLPKELENIKEELNEFSEHHATITVSRKDLENVVRMLEKLLNERNEKEVRN